MSLEPSVPPVLIGSREEVPELPPNEMDEQPAGVDLPDASSVFGRTDEQQSVTLTSRDELRFDRLTLKLKKSSRVAKVGGQDVSEGRRSLFPACFSVSSFEMQSPDGPLKAGFWFLGSP